MRFALAGNPNCGKTTLFNALTGSTAHVGNWPGVTVDKREGSYRKKGVKIDVVDLPGIYSLSPYTPEEVVSRNFIIDEKPDVIVDVVDSTNLERNLYLTTQLLELDAPVIIALNMTDVLQKDKRKIDTEKLSEVFGVPVVEISALRGKGLDEMMRVAAKAADSPRKGVSFAGENSGISGLYRSAYALYEQAGVNNAAFRAVKALEGDELEKNKNPRIVEQIERLCEEGTDYEALVADARYKFISSRCKDAVSGKKQQVKLSKSDKIDRVLTHRIWGIPLFLIIMLAVFHLTFSEDFLYLGAMGAIPETAEPTIWNDIFGNGAINAPGTILFNLMDIATSRLGEVIAGAMPEGTWYASLVNDGICGGVFSVLSFIPQILVLFLFLSILEDSGYMARVAFIMDRAFRKFGLSGAVLLVRSEDADMGGVRSDTFRGLAPRSHSVRYVRARYSRGDSQRDTAQKVRVQGRSVRIHNGTARVSQTAIPQHDGPSVAKAQTLSVPRRDDNCGCDRGHMVPDQYQLYVPIRRRSGRQHIGADSQSVQLVVRSARLRHG